MMRLDLSPECMNACVARIALSYYLLAQSNPNQAAAIIHHQSVPHSSVVCVVFGTLECRNQIEVGIGDRGLRYYSFVTGFSK